jgi:hypothetical protein
VGSGALAPAPPTAATGSGPGGGGGGRAPACDAARIPARNPASYPEL